MSLLLYEQSFLELKPISYDSNPSCIDLLRNSPVRNWLVWWWPVMNVVCYERGLLWLWTRLLSTWSVMNRSVLNIVCYDRICYELVCFEREPSMLCVFLVIFQAQMSYPSEWRVGYVAAAPAQAVIEKQRRPHLVSQTAFVVFKVVISGKKISYIFEMMCSTL